MISFLLRICKAHIRLFTIYYTALLHGASKSRPERALLAPGPAALSLRRPRSEARRLKSESDTEAAKGTIYVIIIRLLHSEYAYSVVRYQ